MIFTGPFAPNRIVVTFVVSENVGEGGPGDVLRRELKDRARIDLAAMAGTWKLRRRQLLHMFGFPFLCTILSLTLEVQNIKYLNCNTAK